MGNPARSAAYPESEFGGFTRLDGTVLLLSRVQALLLELGKVTVLEVGCGRGTRAADAVAYRRKLQDFRGPDRHVIGIDVDPAAAANPFLDEFRPLDPDKPWPVDTASVGLLFCDHVLEHVEHPDAFFDEVARVLAPGGVAAFRTPNAWGYVALISRLVPNRRHAAVIRRANRFAVRKEAQDVFPVFYRCNTPRAIRRALASRGFAVAAWAVEGEPSYFDFSALLYRVAAVLHPWIPGPLRGSVVAFARKGGAGAAELPPVS
jgi:SAM-dependent methyltransferase